MNTGLAGILSNLGSISDGRWFPTAGFYAVQTASTAPSYWRLHTSFPCVSRSVSQFLECAGLPFPPHSAYGAGASRSPLSLSAL